MTSFGLPPDLPLLSFPPRRPNGTVIGVAMNDRRQVEALAEVAQGAPYKGLPRSPVLYVKPRNTRRASGDEIAMPLGADAVEVGANIGLVIGRTACRVAESDFHSVVAGCVLISDLSIPHTSLYRPSVPLKAWDGSCVIGTAAPLSALGDVDALAVTVRVDGEIVQQTVPGHAVRSAAQLLADVSEFMTLHPGDVLMLGTAWGAPQVRAGQQVEIEAPGLRVLRHRMIAPLTDCAAGQHSAAVDATIASPRTERLSIAVPFATSSQGPLTGGSSPTARVAYAGAIHSATPAHAGHLRLADGRVVAEDAVTWLAPFEVGTIIALGLNYADHVKELSKELTVTTRDEPLVFFQGLGSVIGHRGQTRRPAGAQFMHYECELAVVIGRTAHRVRREDALRFVAGYTVCNDYAVRDYLENWYRPNLRVKNRDGGTVLGPWLVDAAAVPDPQALTLRTRVNGQVTQQGHTSNMVNSVAELIEYLSAFMTLQPGDVILTGTPEGVVNVNEGDVVETEIDGIGCLVNTLVGDATFGR